MQLIFLLFIFLGTGCTSLEKQSLKNTLREPAFSDAISFLNKKIEISGPFEKILSEAKNNLDTDLELKYSGTISIDEVSQPIELQARGRSTLIDCSFAKLKIKFNNASENTILESKKMRINTHCGVPEHKYIMGDEKGPILESLAYSFLKILSNENQPFWKFILNQVTYKDTETGESSTHWALFIESSKSFRSRYNLEKYEEPDHFVTAFHKLDPNSLNFSYFHFFNTLVGHRDYSAGIIAQSLGSTDVIWSNVESFLKSDKLFLAPYDFDRTAITSNKPGLSTTAKSFVFPGFYSDKSDGERLLRYEAHIYRSNHASHYPTVIKNFDLKFDKLVSAVDQYKVQFPNLGSILDGAKKRIKDLSSISKDEYIFIAHKNYSAPGYKTSNLVEVLCTLRTNAVVNVLEIKEDASKVQILTKNHNSGYGCVNAEEEEKSSFWVSSSSLIKVN